MCSRSGPISPHLLRPSKAVTFSDLLTESALKSRDDHISGKNYVSGDSLTMDDAKVYAAVVEKPSDHFTKQVSGTTVILQNWLGASLAKPLGVRIASHAAPLEVA